MTTLDARIERERHARYAAEEAGHADYEREGHEKVLDALLDVREIRRLGRWPSELA